MLQHEYAETWWIFILVMKPRKQQSEADFKI